MKKFKFYLSVAWGPALIYLVLLVCVVAFMFFRLGSLTPSISEPEKDTLSHLVSRDLGLREIVQDPQFLPYQLGIYFFEKVGLASPFIARSLGAFIGLAAVISFYYILSRWHTSRIALLGTLLFLTSSWFLHTARLATPEVSFLLLLPLVACGAWLNDTQRRDHFTLAAAALSAGLLLYIPGMIWFVLAGLIWQRKRVRLSLASFKPWQILLVGILGMAVLAPIVIAATDRPAILLTIIGLPDHVIGWREVLTNLANIPKQLFFRGPDNPAYWLGSTPLLDAFTSAMFIIGLYASYFRLRLDRTKLLLFGLVVGSALVAAGTATLSILLPLVYILVAAGIGFMLQQWFTVFPRNPLARGIAWAFISIAISTSCYYNVKHYFVAWPNSPDVKSSFSERL